MTDHLQNNVATCLNSRFAVTNGQGPPWSWSYIWNYRIHDYLCNQWLSPLTLWVRIPEYSEKTTDLPLVKCKLYHIMFYRVDIAWTGFELTTLVVICIHCICSCKSNYRRSRPRRSLRRIYEIKSYLHLRNMFWWLKSNINKLNNLKASQSIETLFINTGM